jgi:hypothetical protein
LLFAVADHPQLRTWYFKGGTCLKKCYFDGFSRLVAPYSLRMPKTGNLLLYVFEIQRGLGQGEGIRALKVAELRDVEIADRPFAPRYLVELQYRPHEAHS